MPFIETELWSLEIPDEWHAEQHEDSVTIVDVDELGSLDLSALKKQGGAVTRDDLIDFAQALLDQSHQAVDTEVAGHAALYFEYNEDEVSWREWYVACDAVFLYVTYNTDRENSGIDDVVIDQILSTLVVVDQSEQ